MFLAGRRLARRCFGSLHSDQVPDLGGVGGIIAPAAWNPIIAAVRGWRSELPNVFVALWADGIHEFYSSHCNAKDFYRPSRRDSTTVAPVRVCGRISDDLTTRKRVIGAVILSDCVHRLKAQGDDGGAWALPAGDAPFWPGRLAGADARCWSRRPVPLPDGTVQGAWG